MSISVDKLYWAAKVCNPHLRCFQRCRQFTLLFGGDCKLLTYSFQLLFQQHIHSVALRMNCRRIFCDDQSCQVTSMHVQPELANSPQSDGCDSLCQVYGAEQSASPSPRPAFRSLQRARQRPLRALRAVYETKLTESVSSNQWMPKQMRQETAGI